MKYQIFEKSGLYGISSAGVFASRMQLAEPESYDLCLSICSNAVQPLPMDSINGVNLPYPLGTYDYEKIFHKKFNLEEYKKAHQLFIVGEEESNERYNIAYFNLLHDKQTQDKFTEVYGRVTLHISQEQMSEIFSDAGFNNVSCLISPGGHSLEGKGNDTMDFLNKVLYSQIYSQTKNNKNKEECMTKVREEKTEEDAIIEREKMLQLESQARAEKLKEKSQKMSVEVQRKKIIDRVCVIEFKYSTGYKGLTAHELAEFKMRKENEAKNRLAIKRDLFLSAITTYGIDSPEAKFSAKKYAVAKIDLENVTNSSPRKLAKQQVASVNAAAQSELAITRFRTLFHELALKEVTNVSILDKERKTLAKLHKLADVDSMAMTGERVDIPNKATNARDCHENVKSAQAAERDAIVTVETLKIAEKEPCGKTNLFVAGTIVGDDRANNKINSIRKSVLAEKESSDQRN